jgi:sigma-B regulation protein RsbU (phosphoserine phosphatase)
VGGDFFDFFQLDENRLAIFMAEGGGRGLGSALTIAFAKGYLLPKIKGSAANDDSPVDIVRSLAFRLRQTLVHETGVGFVYAVIDTSENRLRYARTGAFPRLVIGRADGTAPVQDPDEENITFTDPAGRDGAIDIAQGLQDLESGDCLILFTDGLASSLSEGRHSAASRIWSELQGYEARDGDGLQAALRETVAAGAKRAAKLGIEDDLTALVIRLVSTNRKAIEVNS